MTIRERVLAHVAVATEKFADELLDAGEVFYYVGGKSWPTFVREIKRMERDDLIRIERDWDEMDDVWVGLPEVDEPGVSA